MPESNLTIFEVKSDLLAKAIESFVSGKTPNDAIKQKPGKGGGTENYVNIYWMVEQVGLLTGFRWKSECLEERMLPNNDKPREVGAKMKVTIWDKDGREYSHTSWGQKAVAYSRKDQTPLSIFDDLKSAYSDGIKKCLSYIGIARDVYGGKEVDYFEESNTQVNTNTGEVIEPNASKMADEFDKYVNKVKLNYDKVFEILKIESLSEITDYKEAYNNVKEYIENKKTKSGGDVQ